jgi:hypothetical protein
MTTKRRYAVVSNIAVSFIIFNLCTTASAQSPWDAIKNKIKGINSGPTVNQLSNDKVIAGLKEALQISTSNAVAATGHTDGFFKNEAIKILLPEKLRTAGKALRMVGMGGQVDALEVGMNRAAEQATPQAKQIFLRAVTNMSFADAKGILTGGDTAATAYFRKQSSAELTTAFAPIVHKSMESVGVIKQYNQIIKNPMAAAVASEGNFNIDNYVVGKTMDGLFYMLGEEEKKIRKDPAAQVTSLLKQVFGAAANSKQQAK